MFESNVTIFEPNVTIFESNMMIFEANMVTWSTMYDHIWAFETPPPDYLLNMAKKCGLCIFDIFDIFQKEKTCVFSQRVG